MTVAIETDLTAAESLGGRLVVGVKRCTRCGEEKPLEEFYRDKRATDGRASACRACERNRARSVRETPERQEYMRAYLRRHRAEHPDYYRAKGRRLYRENPERHREKKRRWDEANRDLVNRRAREHYERVYATAEGRARILEANARQRIGVEGGPDPELVARVAELYQMPCAYCGSPDEIEVDHIVPISRGGKHELSNLAPACGFCNKSKRDKLVEEWLRVAA